MNWMTADRDTATKLWRFCAMVGAFALVGPALGGLVAWAMMGARTMRSPLPFIVGSYGEGLWLAVGAGALVAFAALWLGRTSWVVPIVAAVAVNSVMLAVNAAVATVKPDVITGSLRLAAVFFPPSLIATTACWWLTRPLSRSA